MCGAHVGWHLCAFGVNHHITLHKKRVCLLNSLSRKSLFLHLTSPPSRSVLVMAFEYDWWKYFLIPWIAGAVGYFTNVLALQMTFYPLEFWGIKLFRIESEPWGLFGWQGIIPTKGTKRRETAVVYSSAWSLWKRWRLTTVFSPKLLSTTAARKMSEVTFDLMTTKLFKIKEVFGRLEPARFSEVMSDPLLLLLDDIVSTVAKTYMPTAWESMPQEVKDDLVLTADQETGAFLTDFMADMQEHIDDVVDIKHMSVTYCVANKHLIVKIFQECGEQEFIFIRRSGFYFGFLFGCTCFSLCAPL